MSQAAEIILCSGAAEGEVRAYMIRARQEFVDLRLAVNSLLSELRMVREVTHLFAGEYEITRQAACPLVQTMIKIETGLPDRKDRAGAVAFMNTMAVELGNGIQDFHFAVTGEALYARLPKQQLKGARL